MNSTSKVLREVAARREAQTRLDAVRKPWHSWQTLFLQNAVLVLALCSYFAPSFSMPAKWWRAGLLVASLVLLVVNQHLREKAWRRLIEFEAPELDRKLKGTDA
jgi:hypothetical protein